MTNSEKFTAAQLDQLTQHLAAYGEAVDGFVDQARSQVSLDGPAIATAVLADHVANQLDEDQLAAVAAIALVRLSELSSSSVPAHASVADWQSVASTWCRIAVQLARGEGTYRLLTTVDRDRLEAALFDAAQHDASGGGA